MSTSLPYTSTPYAAPPGIGRRAFRGWERNLMAYREAECPLERATTYYVEFSADPSDDGSSPETPLRANTAAGLQSLINTYLTSGVRMRVQSGTAWGGTLSGIILNMPSADDWTFDTYGQGEKPVVHGSETIAQLGGSAWSNLGGGKWSTTLGSSQMSGKTAHHLLPDWDAAGGPDTLLRRTNRYEKQTAVGNVVSVGQWHYDTGTRVLTVMPWTDVNGGTPTLTNHRIVTHAGGTGNHVMRIPSNNGCRIEGFALIGTGGQLDQAWGLAWEGGGNRVLFVQDISVGYNALHNFGQYRTAAGSAGGFMYGRRIICGPCNDETAIPITQYNYQGGQEYGFERVEIYGYSVDLNNASGRYRCSQAVYSHTNGGGILASMGFVDGLYVWGGRGGCNAVGWAGDPPNTKNWRAGDSVTEVRVWFRNVWFNLGGIEIYLNSGNAVRLWGVPAGHAEANVLVDNIKMLRTTAGIEYGQISTTNYELTGWSFNRRHRELWAPMSGSHNMATTRNNLSGGTYPNKQGIIQTYYVHPSIEYVVQSGHTNAGQWGGPAFHQFGNQHASTGLAGVSNAHANSCNWLNGVIACDNQTGDASKNYLFGAHKGDPRGTGMFTDAFAATVAGGMANCSFYGLKGADVTASSVVQNGSDWFVTNRDCNNLAALPDLGTPPAEEGPLFGSLGALPAHCDALEYDFFDRPRLHSAAYGPRGAMVPLPRQSASTARRLVSLGVLEQEAYAR